MNLRIKLLAPIFAAGIFSLALTTIFWIPIKRDSELKWVHQRVQQQFEFTIQTLVEPMLGGNTAQIHSLLDFLRAQHPEWLAIELRNNVGNTLYPLQIEPLPKRPNVSSLQQDIHYLNERLGNLTILIDETPAFKLVDEEIDEITRTLLATFLLAILLVIPMYERFLRRPVIALANASRRLGLGEYDAELPQAGKDELGQLITAFRTMRDARRDAEKSLLARETQLRQVLSNAPITIWTTDTQGQITFREGQQTTFSNQLAESSPVDTANLIHESPAFAGFVEAALTGREIKSELLLEKSWYEVHFSPLRDAQGGITGVLGIGLDISERKHDEEQLRLAATVYNSTEEGMMITNLQTQILSVNSAFTTLTGFSAEEAIGKTPKLLSSGRQDKEFYKKLWKSVKTMGSWQGEIWNKRKDGEVYPEWLTISTVRNKHGEPTHYVAVFSDITERLKAAAKIEHLAYHDPLTDLPNRRLLIDRFHVAAARARRENHQLAIMVVDLDHFKRINDTLGHSTGDKLLTQVAQRLTPLVRNSDTLSRQGGDEFAMLFAPIIGIEDAAVIARRIIGLMSKPFNLDGHTVAISPSVGASIFPHDGDNFDTLLKHADTAMYQAKNRGRNTIQLYDPGMNSIAAARLDLEFQLRQAIEKEEFVLHYQPQFDIATGRITGAEALVRWRQGDKFVPPGEFLPVLEDTGLIIPAGTWIIREASRQLACWREQGSLIENVAVNISAVQFRRGDLTQIVTEALEEFDLEPSCLELEITESVMLDGFDNVSVTLEALRKIGVRLSIDDFGTGYSSLSYLQRLSAHKLKIDQSFVREITQSADSASIVRAVIEMARAIHLTTIAEGVETEEQLERLRAMGCQEAQGYLFSRPLDAENFTVFARNNRQSPPAQRTGISER